MDLQLEGRFLVPTLDPLQYSISDVTVTISVDAGGAVWDPTGLNPLAFPSVLTTFDVGYPIDSLLTGDGAVHNSGNLAFVSSLEHFGFPSSMFYPELFVAGGSSDEGGHISVPFLFDVNNTAIGPALGRLTFIAKPVLHVTFNAGSTTSAGRFAATASSLILTDQSGPQIWSVVQLDPSNPTVPQEILDQLPAYLLQSDVPEPTFILPSAASLLAFIWLARNKRTTT